MTGPRFADAARAYWAALGRKDEVPELPEETFDAFVELLHLGAEEAHAFELLEPIGSPYASLVLGDERRPHRLHWAIELAELEAFVEKSDRAVYYLADSHPDPKGNHRVYSLEDGIRGLVEFADVSDALHWMAAKIEAARAKKPLDEGAEARIASLEDLWEDSASSGFHVLEALLDAPFVEAYDAYSKGEWPVVDPNVPSFRFKRQGPWQRALALYLVRRFLAQRIVDVPRSLKPSELGKPLRALVERLEDFAHALAGGMIPEPIDSLVDAEDAELRKRARAWVNRHESWRATSGKPAAEPAGDDEDWDEDEEPGADEALAAVLAKVLGGGAKKKAASAEATKAAPKSKAGARSKASAAPEPEPEPEAPPPETPFLRALRTALASALEAMVAEELVELDDAKRPALIEELVEAGANARTANHLLKAVTDTLVSSDHVDEVYATDDEVERFIRTRLERR